MNMSVQRRNLLKVIVLGNSRYGTLLGKRGSRVFGVAFYRSSASARVANSISLRALLTPNDELLEEGLLATGIRLPEFLGSSCLFGAEPPVAADSSSLNGANTISHHSEVTHLEEIVCHFVQYLNKSSITGN